MFYFSMSEKPYLEKVHGVYEKLSLSETEKNKELILKCIKEAKELEKNYLELRLPKLNLEILEAKIKHLKNQYNLLFSAYDPAKKIVEIIERNFNYHLAILESQVNGNTPSIKQKYVELLERRGNNLLSKIEN